MDGGFSFETDERNFGELSNQWGETLAVKGKFVGDIAVVKVKGMLMGGDETEEVREKVKNLVSHGTRKIVIDLGKVKWMNSHGIGMLMACYSAVQNVNGKLVIARISEKVRNIMMITNVIKLFDTFDTVDQAVSSLK